MKQQIENIIKKNLPEKKEKVYRSDGKTELFITSNFHFNQALSQIPISLIADEVLKITKCDCCDEKDEHIFPDDRSTTRISRPCGGCGKHQTIAGALLKSKEWEKWYKYASENMLFDVDETLTVDAMSDEHWNSFMKFLNDEVLKVVIRKIEEIETFEPEDDFIDGGDMEYASRRLAVDNSRRWGEIKIKTDILQLLSNLSTNKENKNNENTKI